MALDSRVIAGALAHGLSPGAMATWDPRLARTPRVMVPVELDVLMVREEGGSWAQTAMTVPDPGSQPQAHTLLPDPFSERAPRPTGAYLHWALPDALTGGSGTAHGGDVSFRPIPDRWLVVRLSTPQPGARRAVTAWVLESGGQQPVVTPLDSWTEPEDPERTTTPGEQPLTVLGHGDAAWSAYFDNVENRLAFYDDLTDGQGGTVPGPLAYLVCGWHSRHIDDPIGEGLSSPAAFEARLADLGWEINPADIEKAFSYADTRVTAATAAGLATREATFSRVATAASGYTVVPAGYRDEGQTTLQGDGTPLLGRLGARAVSWPELTLYHGGVVGIGWPGPGIGVAPDGLAGGDIGGPPPADSVTVTIGNTLTEALAARLARNEGAPDEARALEAVLLGGTQELDQPDAPARIDSLLHASGFAGLPGGVRTEDLAQRPAGPPASVIPDPSRTDPGVFAGQSAGPGVSPGTTRIGPSGTAGALAGNVRTDALTRISPAIRSGTMDTLVKGIKDALVVPVAVPPAPNADPGEQTVSSDRTLPRYFVPADPVFLLENAGRSFKHGSDGAHAESGLLVCRLSGETVTGLAPSLLAAGPGASVRGQDLLARGVDHGGVPPECEDLLAELALTDPGSAETAAAQPGRQHRGDRRGERSHPGRSSGGSARRLPGRGRGGGDLGAGRGPDLRGGAGRLVDHPGRPAGRRRADRPLGLRRHPAAPSRSGCRSRPGSRCTWTGRPSCSPSPGCRTGSSARSTSTRCRTRCPRRTPPPPARCPGGRCCPAGRPGSPRPPSGRRWSRPSAPPGRWPCSRGSPSPTTRPWRSRWSPRSRRCGPGTRAGRPRPRAAHRRARRRPRAEHRPPGRDGRLRPHRRRTGGDGRPGRRDGPVHLKDPRGLMWPMATTPRRMARCRETSGRSGPGSSGSPGCGWWTASARSWICSAPGQRLRPPATADPALRAADRDRPRRPGGACSPVHRAVPALVPVPVRRRRHHRGQRHGLPGLRFRAARTTWTATCSSTPRTGPRPARCGSTPPPGWSGRTRPGRPATVGSLPSSIISNRHLAGLAQGLLDWGAADSSPDTPDRDTALSSLLRIIDTSLWSVDPFGHIGEEHLSLLVGHPVAVLRGLVRVEVAEPVDPRLVQGMRVPVRLGALAQWQDGLLAYLIGDDGRTLHVPDPAVADFARPIGPHQGFTGQAATTSDYYNQFASDLGVVADPGSTPVDHPYVDTSGLLWVQPGQDVPVTMLAEPHSVIHATTGYLPRKQIAMRRNWVAPGLAALAPLFRFGPVLVDPKLIRMPVASDIRGTWSWSHRSDASTWADDPVTNSLGDARMPPDPSQGQEGWLRLTPEEPLP